MTLLESNSGASRTLHRELGLLSATMIVVGGIIGGGIFFTPAQVARTLPTGGWVLAIWMIGGFIALAGALTFAELGAMLPDAGGPFVYIRRAFGERAAFVYGWMI
ncbi:MAG: amino acid permease, partial [Gemmatimonadaceae bacterium]